MLTNFYSHSYFAAQNPQFGKRGGTERAGTKNTPAVEVKIQEKKRETGRQDATVATTLTGKVLKDG